MIRSRAKWAEMNAFKRLRVWLFLLWRFWYTADLRHGLNTSGRWARRCSRSTWFTCTTSRAPKTALKRCTTRSRTPSTSSANTRATSWRAVKDSSESCSATCACFSLTLTSAAHKSASTFPSLSSRRLPRRRSPKLFPTILFLFRPSDCVWWYFTRLSLSVPVLPCIGVDLYFVSQVHIWLGIPCKQTFKENVLELWIFVRVSFFFPCVHIIRFEMSDNKRVMSHLQF